MPENHIIIEKTIELVKAGESVKAKEYLLDCSPDVSLYAFRTGLVFGQLHEIDRDLAHTFIGLFNDELTEWYATPLIS